VSSTVVDRSESEQESETPNPLLESELGVVCPQVASIDAERLRPDSNRGWWICNPSTGIPKQNGTNNLGDETGFTYRPGYRADWEADELVDRRLYQDPRLARLALIWPELSASDQELVMRLAERMA